ncbi:polyadenylation and cleavage factor homolog 4-like [Impatiens glandulifera]|uniref:polyadenylation and cleavage factor homolog 4-like n=1 Tax=Impatiens glandulifera TaxID=253017 RepID=UPI001FB0D566|nr:polyadenylation and cleavage factor homolog 4-like [Impatiens glandulifera]
MEEQTFDSTMENPRTLAFNGVNKSMVGGDVTVQKPVATILDRFKAMLKDIDDGDDVPTPSSHDVVRIYDHLLSELTLNSKPIITDLTIIAGELKEHGAGIAEAICARIIEVPPEQKLPALYLLDSITKNIGREYIRHFSSRLPEVFREAYRQVNPDLHPAMRHLFGTWSAVFPQSVLHRIETQLQFSSMGAHQSSGVTKASESPRPAHGIHVNPKYLEARQQFDPSNLDGNSHRASILKIYGKKSANELDEYDSDNAGMVQMRAGTEFSRHPNPGLERSSTQFGTEFRITRSAVIDDFTMNGSPKRVIDKRGLPSHPRHEMGFGRVMDSGENINARPRDPRSNYFYGRAEASAASDRAEDLQRPRALIDAYGRDHGEGTASDRFKIARLHGNDLGRVATETWHHTEVEEFDWKNMSRTVAERNNLNGGSLLSSGRFGMGPGNQNATEDLVSFVSGHESIGKLMGSHGKTTQYPGSHYLQESQGHQIRSLASGIPSSLSEPLRLIDRASDGALFHGTSMGAPSRGPHTAGNLAAIMSISQGSWTHSDMQIPNPASAHPFSQQRHRDHFELTSNKDMGENLGMRRPNFLENHLDAIKNRSTNIPPFPSQQVGYLPQNLQPHALASQEVQQRLMPVGSVSVPAVLPPKGHVYPQLGLSAQNAILNQPPLSASRVWQGGGGLQPLPLGPHSTLTQIMPTPLHLLQGATNPPPSGSSYSGLIGSLMSQGLISLTNPSVQDSVELSFNHDVLKMRHETSITALYSDLPRQCTACGLRFKNQEEHSSHMDWHVTKNRISKNRKQSLARRWFVSVNMWLTGAEALGTDVAPGFLPAENTVEMKEDELAVPADEDQKVCALCGEPFEEFYSDETEEWMYKGAVYMNDVPTGSTTAGMYMSQLGPIIHAKCRSESSVAADKKIGQDEGVEGGDEKKRLRLS